MKKDEKEAGETAEDSKWSDDITSGPITCQGFLAHNSWWLFPESRLTHLGSIIINKILHWTVWA